MQVTLIDSPYANIANIARALRAAGAELRLSAEADEVERSTKVVLPGVGTFGAAMHWLRERRLDQALRAAVRNHAFVLGVCVGHQLLFRRSEEMGETTGLGLLEGEVRPLGGTLPIPQIGWNRLESIRSSALLAGIAEGTAFYFVNSYAVTGAADQVAQAIYGEPFTAVVERGRICGVQFHPEKSAAAGLRLLRNFVTWN